MTQRKHCLFAAILLVIALSFPVRADAGAAPKVVVSLPPLHALAAALMEGVGTPTLIVQSATSEHVHALRPSEAESLAEADLIVWVGPVMEDYLIKPLAALPKHGHVLSLIDLPKLTRLPLRAGGAFEPDAHDADEPPPDSSDTARVDGHIWLDPKNAKVMADAMAAALAQADPAHAGLYARNLAALQAMLGALDDELARRFALLRGKPIIVFHDAYHYLEARYGLDVVGAITVSPELPASAKRVAEIRARITAHHAVCVFSEPQFEPRLVRTLIEGTSARTGVLDPLGVGLAPDKTAYGALLHRIADSLEACLSG